MLLVVLTVSIGLSTAAAADISGRVVITRKLTKKKVTPPAPAYYRGVTVRPASPEPDDPLALERTRVVIYLEGDLPTGPVQATIEQKHRRFTPDTVVLPVGSTVSFPNLDPIFHNVFSLSKPKTFDLGNYPKGQTRTVTFSKPGLVFVNCHLHPNMSAAIVVTPNRWSTTPDDAGNFALSGVPPGVHKIVAWHKAAGFYRREVRVNRDEATAVDFVIPIEDRLPGEIAKR